MVLACWEVSVAYGAGLDVRRRACGAGLLRGGGLPVVLLNMKSMQKDIILLNVCILKRK